MTTIGIVLLMFAAVGGFWGWYRATKALYRRSGRSDRPDTISVSDYERQVVSARKRRRLVTTAAFTVGGAAVGFVLLLAVAVGR
jgi:hypothetical protein